MRVSGRPETGIASAISPPTEEMMDLPAMPINRDHNSCEIISVILARFPIPDNGFSRAGRQANRPYANEGAHDTGY